MKPNSQGDIHIFGVGHNTPVFVDLVEACGFRVAGIYHHDETKIGEICGSRRVSGTHDQFFRDGANGKQVALSMGDNEIRVALASKVRAAGGITPAIIHPSASVSRFAKLDEGVVVHGLALIQAEAVIGSDTVVSAQSAVIHQCKIGRGCYIAVHACVGAYAEVGNFVLIGMGSCLVSNKAKRVGDRATIGAGAVVISDVAADEVVVGNPARPIRRDLSVPGTTSYSGFGSKAGHRNPGESSSTSGEERSLGRSSIGDRSTSVEQKVKAPPNKGHYSEAELRAMGIKFGNNVQIHRTVQFFGNNVSIGSNVRIDCFCTISSDAEVSIGNHVHLGSYACILGGAGVTIEDFAGLSARVTIFTATDDYTSGHLSNPTVPDEFRCVRAAPVVIERHAILGVGSVVLPGVRIGKGASIGAFSLVIKDVSAHAIAMGAPLREIGRRDSAMLEQSEKHVTVSDSKER